MCAAEQQCMSRWGIQLWIECVQSVMMIGSLGHLLQASVIPNGAETNEIEYNNKTPTMFMQGARVLCINAQN